jgi:hypothetical protein
MLFLPSTEDPMCWEMDYLYFAELEKAKKAEAAREKRTEVISDLLTEANKRVEKAGEAVPVSEPLPAK